MIAVQNGAYLACLEIRVRWQHLLLPVYVYHIDHRRALSSMIGVLVLLFFHSRLSLNLGNMKRLFLVEEDQMFRKCIIPDAISYLYI